MKRNQSAFLIAAPSSSSGKTTVTLGLMQALVNRGLVVQPFKCGPDYIDPMYHSAIAGRPSYNLDTWMASKTHVMELFQNQASKSQVSVIEGVMGLFDGAVKSQGSAADIAKLLNIPVILVMDAKAMAYSAAPLLFGFKHFDDDLNIAGVIFNRVSGDSHYQYLRDAAIDAGVEPLGYLTKDEQLIMPSRHLGLTLPSENPTLELAQKAAELLEKHVDIDRLLELSQYQINKTHLKAFPIGKLKIAIASDKAYCFMYQANIDALMQLGEVTFFSPLHDQLLPTADVVWLPGGYPELYAKELSNNTLMLNAIAQHSQQGKILIAECGGFMLTGKQLHQNGESYPMAGIFDYETSLDNMKLTLGYRQLNIDGNWFRGHEFHYSQLINIQDYTNTHLVLSARETEVKMPVFRQQKTFASYLHLYLGETGKMEAFLDELWQDKN
jgi:cobyrinic acid a,c-diamide synthase